MKVLTYLGPSRPRNTCHKRTCERLCLRVVGRHGSRRCSPRVSHPRVALRLSPVSSGTMMRGGRQTTSTSTVSVTPHTDSRTLDQPALRGSTQRRPLPRSRGGAVGRGLRGPALRLFGKRVSHTCAGGPVACQPAPSLRAPREQHRCHQGQETFQHLEMSSGGHGTPLL